MTRAEKAEKSREFERVSERVVERAGKAIYLLCNNIMVSVQPTGTDTIVSYECVL